MYFIITVYIIFSVFPSLLDILFKLIWIFSKVDIFVLVITSVLNLEKH